VRAAHFQSLDAADRRRLLLEGQRALRKCVGSDAGFIEPDIAAPTYATPKAAIGFAVERKSSRRARVSITAA
jgi:hypothetical protein